MVIQDEDKARGRPAPLPDQVQVPGPQQWLAYRYLFSKVLLEDVKLLTIRQPSIVAERKLVRLARGEKTKGLFRHDRRPC
jgi:hypothetical protein